MLMRGEALKMTLLFLAPASAVLAFIFAGWLEKTLMKNDEGTDQMKQIALFIRKGANAYLKRQYTGVALFFAIVFVVLLVLGLLGYLTMFVPFAFLTGGFFFGHVRIHRHEGRHIRQRPYCSRLFDQPEQGAADRVFQRSDHGLSCGGSGLV
jgi:uncharacterized membrane protein YphA (DoxX/SURF4 family)